MRRHHRPRCVRPMRGRVAWMTVAFFCWGRAVETLSRISCNRLPCCHCITKRGNEK